MSEIAHIEYLGSLRTEAEHLRSGSKILNDAPTDNNGRGEAFSPTDTVATALGTCALTVMGIRAQKEGFDLEGAEVTVDKQMESEPRRIGTITLSIKLRANCDEKMRKILEGIGRNCPVAKSLHPDLKQVIHFTWY